jgi:EAL domain-containing protein (putative c-di-GMP-specific phosphodiesterase class I)
VLGKVRELGATVALDDFGTGYSSLSTLRTLPIDRVKIDRSFVSSMLVNPGDLAIVQSLVDLARRLGLGTVAEGVESAAIRDRLTEFQCDEAQGYLFMRPATSADLLTRLGTHRTSRAVEVLG